MRFVLTLFALTFLAVSAHAFTLPWAHKKETPTGDNTPPVPKQKTQTIRPIVRMTPDVSFPAEGSRTRTLRSLRGQPVVILLADTPRNKRFRKQIRFIEPIYSDLAARKAVFIAGFTKAGEGPVQSNVPFTVTKNGPAVASVFGADPDFAIIIIGPDGNVDYQTDKVISGNRVRDVMQNTFTIQKANMKASGN